MSHKATNWAIAQRGLKPAVKIVLWYLCDRHNRDYGCFPSQETLVEDCELPRATLNRHLAALEEMRLIRRVQRSDKKTQKQKSTMYLFAFDFEDPYAFDPTAPEPGSDVPDQAENSDENQPKPCPKMRHGSVSQKQAIPCPKKGDSRVSKWDTNPVREPLRNQRASGGVVALSKIAAFWINAILEGRYGGTASIRPDVADEIARSGLLSDAQLRQAGLPAAPKRKCSEKGGDR